MPRLWSMIRQKPVRATARTGLRTSAAFPTSGTTSLDNSEGASQAVAELLDSLDVALSQIILEDDPTAQLTAQLEKLNQKASGYVNSSLDFCSSRRPWECTAEMANLIMKAWICAETVYERDTTVSSENMKVSDLEIEWSLPSSINGNIKATTLTTFVAPPLCDPCAESTTYLIIAVRGSASTVDQLVNLHGEPRDASVLFQDAEQASDPEIQTPNFQAHAGFLNSAQELLAPVSAQIEKQLIAGHKFKIVCTGHSAGGAVATLLHLSLRARFGGASFSCITFGSPPVAKVITKKDKIALDHVIMQAPVLNIVNEYDLVSRVDRSYIRSIIRLYNSEASSAIGDNLHAAEEPSESRWPLPTPDLQHIGSIVILKTELPNLQLSNTTLSEVNTGVTAWSVTSESMSNLLFCRLQVHKRSYYRGKIEQLATSNYNGIISAERT